ncbi:MAG: SpoIVB peptidase, partial [Firmicutes bacterium]|nr:SpoIVB peptidase [Bacillota bacterium]
KAYIGKNAQINKNADYKNGVQSVNVTSGVDVSTLNMAGIWGVTGVGTVTWYDPQTGRFGALGHGVNEQSGSLINMRQGRVYDAAVTAVRAGRSGTPGQLLGAVCSKDPIGQLAKNTNQGVFGTIDLAAQSQALPVAEPEQVHTGAATIRSTVAGDEVQEYSVEILKVYPSSGSSGRNMLVKVTDPDLLEVTGGIVQGMSGSPIIQDGKLIGAVTHVLVNDPTTGYGIFIENMLDAAA